MWLAYGLSAGLIFGIGDVVAKLSLKNIRPDVLLVITYLGSLGWWGLYFTVAPGFSDKFILGSDLLIFSTMKAALVCGSGLTTFFAIQRLPITASAAIRGTGLIWPALGGTLYFHQPFGAGLTLALASSIYSYMWISLYKKRESDKKTSIISVAVMLFGVMLSGFAIIWDRIAIETIHITPIYQFLTDILCLVMASVFVVCSSGTDKLVRWLRQASPLSYLIGVAFSMGEVVYIYAAVDPDAQLAVLAILRRASIAVSILSSLFLFRDFYARRDVPALLAMAFAILAITGMAP